MMRTQRATVSAISAMLLLNRSINNDRVRRRNADVVPNLC